MKITVIGDRRLFDVPNKFIEYEIKNPITGDVASLDKIEEQSKSFKCVEHCSRCCEAVPLTLNFFATHSHKAKENIYKVFLVDGYVLPLRQRGDKCVFHDGEGCMIYEHRPLVCRLYGTGHGYVCPYVKPNGQRRDSKDEKKILRSMITKAKDSVGRQVIASRGHGVVLLWCRDER